MAGDDNTTVQTGAIKTIIDADRRLLITRLLESEGPLSVAALSASVAGFGHASNEWTVVGDLARLERDGKVKVAPDGATVEAKTVSTVAAPVPRLTEAIDDPEPTPGSIDDRDEPKGRETA